MVVEEMMLSRRGTMNVLITFKRESMNLIRHSRKSSWRTKLKRPRWEMSTRRLIDFTVKILLTTMLKWRTKLSQRSKHWSNMSRCTKNFFWSRMTTRVVLTRESKERRSSQWWRRRTMNKRSKWICYTELLSGFKLTGEGFLQEGRWRRQEGAGKRRRRRSDTRMICHVHAKNLTSSFTL